MDKCNTGLRKSMATTNKHLIIRFFIPAFSSFYFDWSGSNDPLTFFRQSSLIFQNESFKRATIICTTCLHPLRFNELFRSLLTSLRLVVESISPRDKDLGVYRCSLVLNNNIPFPIRYLQLVCNMRPYRWCHNQMTTVIYILLFVLVGQKFHEIQAQGLRQSYVQPYDVRAYRNFNDDLVLHIDPSFLGLIWK